MRYLELLRTPAILALCFGTAIGMQDLKQGITVGCLVLAFSLLWNIVVWHEQGW